MNRATTRNTWTWSATICLIIPGMTIGLPAAKAQTNVLTRSYDDARTGANINETTLTPQNVGGLKLLRSIDLRTFDPQEDLRLEAQPLYVSNIRMKDGQTHKGVLFLCTMANHVYAVDADTGAKLWGPVSVGPGKPIVPIASGNKNDPLQPKPPTPLDMYGINDDWGILSTPVIDQDTMTMYVVNWSRQDGFENKARHFLHAIRLQDGKDLRSIRLIASVTTPPLPQGNDLDPTVATYTVATFTSIHQKQRAALLLSPLQQPTSGGHVGKTLFIASGQFGENLDSPHGWLFAIDVDSFKIVDTLCTTPTTGGGGIWQAGQGPATDGENNVYLQTSNGGWNGKTDYAESLLRIHYTPPTPGTGAALAVTDFFTPFKDSERIKAANGYDFHDQDLGSGAAILAPGLRLVMGVGKDGVLYVLDKDHLGKTVVAKDQTDPAHYPALKSVNFFTYTPANGIAALGDIDSFPDGKTHHLHGSPLLWTSNAIGQMLFVCGENAPVRAWCLKADGSIKLLAEGADTASAFSGHFDAMPGGMMTLSANGGDAGVVWTTVPIKSATGADEGDANKEVVEGVLRAYDATDFGPHATAGGPSRLKLLWDSRVQLPTSHFLFDKFCPPVVADGKVFITTYGGRVDVYGL